jgi:glucose/arabinose dehydrogenase
MRTLLGIVLATTLGLGLAACGGGGDGGTAGGASADRGGEAAAAGAAQLRLAKVVSGLDQPTYVAVAPGDPRRLYVVEQPGRIRTVRGGRVTGTFLDIRRLVSCCGERGLLSVAFHPRYAANRLFYVDYTDTRGDTRVVEYRARAGKRPVRVRQLLHVDQPYPNHNGGQLQFGPDGLLYVGMGDGGSAGDPANRAQNLSTRLGKLLRIDVNRRGASWQIFGYGLRNPWRFSFDRRTHDLWIADVGQAEWEEIDRTPAGTTGLQNYGWDAYEGTHAFEPGDLNSRGTLVQPVHEYSHDDGCSVTGGYVYRGPLAGVRGRYFFGDYCSGSVWSITTSGGGLVRYPFTVSALSSFGEGHRGELYLVSLGGTVYRLVAR